MYVSATFTLTEADSGSHGFKVVYQAYPGETPTIDGGKAVTGWNWVAGQPYFVADVPESAGYADYFRQLYVGGRRAQLAVGKPIVGNGFLAGTTNTRATPRPSVGDFGALRARVAPPPSLRLGGRRVGLCPTVDDSRLLIGSMMGPMPRGEAAGDEPGIKAVSAAAYAATADHFDDPALSFWDRFGRQTVARIGLRPGERVLDACCGTGASAIPAAHLVGAAGQVVGLDVAEPALVLARTKAQAQGLANVEFRTVDVEHTGLPPESFDAVVCVFGVFFLPDMAATVAELWRLVRPGGVLAITVWGPEWLEPATTAFWSAVGAENPDLVGAFHPWTRVTDPAGLAHLFQSGGASTPTVEAEPGTHSLADPTDWWTIVLGTGYRATVQQLDPAAAERVRTACIDWLRRREVRDLQTNVVYARARKPGSH